MGLHFFCKSNAGIVRITKIGADAPLPHYD
jgi:hypothetical protein